MEWYVFIDDFNSKSIRKYNIFDHYYFYNNCKRLAKQKDITKEQFAEKVERDLLYCFWSKCEYETVISSFPPDTSFKEKKIDVYWQVMLNFDRFIDYLWENKNELLHS